jgi:hypothetical protein
MSRNTDLPQRRTTNINDHKIQSKAEPSTQPNEIVSTNEMMKVQPDSQKPTTNQRIKAEADLGITIRWGVRADARRQVHPPRVDLSISRVDRVRGWGRC